MAQSEENSGNWIWWTLGGVALLGLGVGSYFFFSKKGDGGKSKTNEDDKKPTPTVQEKIVYRDRPSSTTTTTTATTGNPFTSVDDLKKFQQWVFDNKKEKIGKRDGTPDGLYGGNTRKAWEKYGKEYQGTSQASQQQSTSWSSTNYEANAELKKLLEQNAQDISRDGTAFQWDTTNTYPTVYVKFYDGGTLTLEKDKAALSSRYAKSSGTWKKVNNGFEFTFGGKTYNAKYDGLDLTNVLYSLMKDANYFSWNDGKAVPFTGGGNDMDIFSMNGGEIILGGGSTANIQDSLL